MDASLASAGFGAVTSYITAQANRDVAEIRANSANYIRGLNNQTAGVVSQRNASITGLQRWAQKVRNERVYEAVAANQEALAVNFNRSRDARSRASFAANIRDAEESGRMQAAAAVSGVTGSVVDVLDQTNVLKQNLQRGARQEADRQAGFDFKRRELSTRLAVMDQLDHSLIFDNPELLDFGHNVARTPSPLSAAIAGMGTKGLQALGTSAGDFFNFGKTDYGLGGLASSGTSGLGD